MTRVENRYLTGDFAPVTEEVTAFDLPVIGEIPAELEGRYLRNGPNPVSQVDPGGYHWFLGTGMVHGVRLRGGRAEWYRNRWVRSDEVTEALGEEPVPRPARGASFSPNTNVGGFAGATWAMVEAGPVPAVLDYELNTVRHDDFSGSLAHGFTAHPKRDPATGDLHALCYAWPELADHIEYVVVGAEGRVTHTAEIAVDDMPMIHDLSITEHHVIVYDLPVTVDVDLALSGASAFPFRWNPDHGARVGVMPLGGSGDDIVWCEVANCYVYHPLNAHETADGRVVVDLCRYEAMFDADTAGPAGDCLPTLDRWIIDPATRTVREERLSDRPCEFPRVRGDRTGRPARYGYTAGLGSDFAPGPTYKHDLVTGETTAHDHGRGRGTAEPAFVARPDGADEDDGWLLSYVSDGRDDISELVILDARDLSESPLARIRLPQRVPVGFHGNWVPDHAVPPPAD